MNQRPHGPQGHRSRLTRRHGLAAAVGVLAVAVLCTPALTAEEDAIPGNRSASLDVSADAGSDVVFKSKHAEADQFAQFDQQRSVAGNGDEGSASSTARQSTTVDIQAGSFLGLSSAGRGVSSFTVDDVLTADRPNARSRDQLSVAFEVTSPVAYVLTGNASTSFTGSTDTAFSGCPAQFRLNLNGPTSAGFAVASPPGDPHCVATDGSGGTIDETGTLTPGFYQLSVDLTTSVVAGAPNTTGTGEGSWDVLFGLCPAGSATASGSPARAQADQCGAPTGHILFTRGVFDDDVFVLSADGTSPSAPLNLAPGNEPEFVHSPAWSPDGRNVVFTEGFTLVVMTAGGSDRRQLTGTGGGGHPDWSPDGQRIAFECDPGICVINADGTNRRQLFANGDNPAWSPGGQKIVFDRFRQGSREIFLGNSDGTGSVRQLTEDPAEDIDPDFGPGGQIVFVSTRDGNSELYRMRSVAGSAQERLTESDGFDGEPTVSPDGNFVAFISSRDGNRDIFVMALLGGAATNITDSAPPEDDPNWGQSACTFYGTGGKDVLQQGGHLCGGPGDDELTGGGAADTLDGGPGRDILEGKGGQDVIFGGDEAPSPSVVDDRIKGGEERDLVFAGDGNDRIVGGGGIDTIEAEGGDDTVDGDGATPDPRKDFLSGGKGADTIDGGDGPDDIVGGEGDDVIDGEEGQDTIAAGPDQDRVRACDGVRDIINGGADRDTATFDQGIDDVTAVEDRLPC